MSSSPSGYARKYAIRLLTHPVPVLLPLTRPREPIYGRAVQDALVVAWAAANRICAKRLVPFLPGLVPVLERHGHLTLTDAVRNQLLARQHFPTRTAARLALFDYIEGFSYTHRRHAALDPLWPLAYERRWTLEGLVA